MHTYGTTDPKRTELYQRNYQRSIKDKENYWKEVAAAIDWFSPFVTTANTRVSSQQVTLEWFKEGTLNACYNAVDRHLNDKADKPALLWFDEQAKLTQTLTYQDLYHAVNEWANVLLRWGVTNETPVAIYLPMGPDAMVAMLACARIGAVHTVIFAGFSSNSIEDRLKDSAIEFIVTTDAMYRNGKLIQLKAIVNEALKNLPNTRLLLKPTTHTEWEKRPNDTTYETLNYTPLVAVECVHKKAEDRLFILYTSGSTGKPKGLVHTTGGYLVYAQHSFKEAFDYQENDVYFCTADVGWITGHSYLTYGPLLNGATVVVFSGTPSYPDNEQLWRVIERAKATILYTSPTAIRSLMLGGLEVPNKYDLTSLRLLATVGEPINSEAWLWLYNTVGRGQCPIIDTYWQTETGGFIITPLPQVTPLKPGSAIQPFYGIEVALIDDNGRIVNEPNVHGNVCVKGSWPGQARTINNDPNKFIDTYFKRFDGYYFTGDGGFRDEDGYIWITGRVDDILNVSGHRLSSFELEEATTQLNTIVEAAVVSYPHPVKGEGVCIFAIPNKLPANQEEALLLSNAVKNHIRKVIGPFATPDKVLLVPMLPKTRSGKIIRRILKKITHRDDNLGDLSTVLFTESINFAKQAFEASFELS